MNDKEIKTKLQDLEMLRDTSTKLTMIYCVMAQNEKNRKTIEDAQHTLDLLYRLNAEPIIEEFQRKYYE